MNPLHVRAPCAIYCPALMHGPSARQKASVVTTFLARTVPMAMTCKRKEKLCVSRDAEQGCTPWKPKAAGGCGVSGSV